MEAPLAAHFSCLVYPFEYTLPQSRGQHRLERWNRRWSSWWSGREISTSRGADPLAGDVTTLLDDSYFFLPHIRQVLWPELSGKVNYRELPDAHRCRRREEVVRLRLREGVRAQIAQLGCTLDGRELRFAIEEVELCFFPPALGFLILRVRHGPDASTLETLRAGLSALRWVETPHAAWTLQAWKVPGAARPLTTRELAGYLLQETTGVAEVHSSLSTYQTAIAADPALMQGKGAESRRLFNLTFGDVFSIFTYAVRGEGEPATDAGLFADSAEQWLWQLTRLQRADDPDMRPQALEVVRWREEEVFAPWDNWRASVSPGHTVFLASRPSPWTMERLPIIVLHDYFHLYLLTMVQRLRLHQILPETQRTHRGEPHRIAEKLWDDFVAFENRFWFTEVTNKPQGHRLYRHLQKGSGTRDLYDELRRQTEDVKQQLDQRFERRINRTLRLLTYVGVPLGLFGNMFGPWLGLYDPLRAMGLPEGGAAIARQLGVEDPSPELERALAWIAVMFLVPLAATAGLAVARWFQRRKHST